MIRNVKYLAQIAVIGSRKIQRCNPQAFQKYRVFLTSSRSASSDGSKPPQSDSTAKSGSVHSDTTKTSEKCAESLTHSNKTPPPPPPPPPAQSASAQASDCPPKEKIVCPPLTPAQSAPAQAADCPPKEKIVCPPLTPAQSAPAQASDCPPKEKEVCPPPPPKKAVCPPPDCPKDDGSQKKYTRLLVGGLIFMALSMFALYHFLRQEKQDKGPKTGTKKRKTKPIVKFPAESKDIPKCVPYLLIGGGTASFSAFRSIKSSDPTAKVLIITNESYNPYMRPPLSKEMWFNEDGTASKNLVFKQWNGTERSLFYEPEDFYVDCKNLPEQSNGGVSVVRGWNVKKVDVTEKTAYLEDGHGIKFKKCLIATGASPKNLPMFENASEEIKEKVTLFRDVYDFEQLYEKVQRGTRHVAIVGGGFLGTELACALARQGRQTGLKVQQIFPESGNLGKVLPEYLSQWTTDKVKSEGVKVTPNVEVNEVSFEKGQLVLKLTNGEKVNTEHAIVAVGVKPNTELAGPSGLEVDEKQGGFLVNAELVARSSVWAAGDCTCFYDVKFGRRQVEHHDHAVVSGRLAGENMTGAGKPYCHQSMFWSDLGSDVGFEAIGIVDSALPTVGVYAKTVDDNKPIAETSCADEEGKEVTKEETPPAPTCVSSPTVPKLGEDYGKGVIFYMRNDTVVGIVLWNVFNRMAVARQVLKDESKYEDLNEVAKLFNIHED